MDDLNNQTQFRLEKLNKIEDYFIAEIREREQMSKKLSKDIAAFDYFDKIIITLSATSGGVSSGVLIVSITTVIEVSANFLSASFSLVFSLTTGIIKKLLQIARNKMKKHKKIVVLARNKLNSIETLASKVLIDYEISNEEYEPIINEEKNYRKMKDFRMMKSEKIDVEKHEINEEGGKIEINKKNRKNNENA